jgi:hypothetical protein
MSTELEHVPLAVQNLFNVKNLVAVVTGGGTGMLIPYLTANDPQELRFGLQELAL